MNWRKANPQQGETEMKMLKEEAEGLDRRIKLLQKYVLALHLFGSLHESARGQSGVKGQTEIGDAQ